MPYGYRAGSGAETGTASLSVRLDHWHGRSKKTSDRKTIAHVGPWSFEAGERRLKPSPPFRFRDALKALGPGLITGASDDDPSGIGTYSQAGAQLGYGIGWTMLLTFPLMAAIQEISARVGRVTGRGMIGQCLPALSGVGCSTWW